MSEAETEAAFLAHVVSYDNTAESCQLQAGLDQAERDQHCVQRALRLAMLLVLISAIGVCCWELLLDGGEAAGHGSPSNTWSGLGVVSTGFWGLGIGSMVAVLALLCLLVRYRGRTGQRRFEGRQFAIRLLEARLGKPPVPPVLEDPKRVEIFVGIPDRPADVAPALASPSSSEPLRGSQAPAEARSGMAGDRI